MEQYEIDMLSKIDSEEKLSERELKSLAFEFDEVDIDKGYNRRWSRGISSYIKIGDRYFCLNWEEGLTEGQENEFYEQPYEVEKKTYEKTITVTEWSKK